MDADMRKRLRWGQLYQEMGNAGIVCRRYGISYPTVRKSMRGYRDAGEANFTPSRI